MASVKEEEKETTISEAATPSSPDGAKKPDSKVGQPSGTATADTVAATKSEGAREEREGFGNGIEFVLTCLGLAVGLGNIWRFPTRAYENGGSAFLIPYLTCAFLFGLPAIYFEFMVGQYQGKSSPVAFRRVMPILEGVGWMGVVVAALVAVYYIVLISWISIYLVNIFRGHVSIWGKCDNAWNVFATCFDLNEQKQCWGASPPGWNGTKLPEKLIFINGSCRDAALYKDIQRSATEQYFYNNVIRHSSGLLDFDGINWPILAAMTVCWILTGLGIVKGTKIMGKISYVSVLMPYCIIVILFIRGITLEGASTGLYYYFGQPDWSKVFLVKTWVEALKQLCFSLSVGHGGLMTLSSYSAKHNNVFKDAMIVIMGDTLMSLIGGAAVFSTLGFLAVQRGVTVPDVVDGGMSLAFVVYPEAMTQMPMPWLWSFLFFLMLFLLGASSEIALVEVFCSCLYDQNKRLANKKWLVVGLWCLTLYIIGLIFTTNAGFFWFELFDEYAAGFSSVCTVFCEIIVIMYAYGFRNFKADITEVVGEPRNGCTKVVGPHSPYFVANWMVISPIIAVLLVGLSFIRQYPYLGKPDVYPAIFDILGWFVSFMPVLVIPIFAGLNLYRFDKRGISLRSLFMLQKQHVSYSRIAEDFDEDQKMAQKQLPDKEPWDEEPEPMDSVVSRTDAAGDALIATIDVTSTSHLVY